MRTRPCPRRRGFSLIELMVALVIAGILAAIAYPMYTSQMQRGRRADAISALTGVMQAQERFRSNNSTYATTLPALNLELTRIAPLYDFSLTSAPAGFETGYVITATPLAGGKQASDTTCKNLVVTLVGATPTYSATGDPGNRDTTAECWPR